MNGLGLGIGAGFVSAAQNRLLGEPYNPVDDAVTGWWLGTEGITLGVGAGVEVWADQSGNGYHWTQLSGGNQPQTGIRSVNSLNAIDFNGTTQRMDNVGTLWQPGVNDTLVLSVIDLDNTSSGRIFNNRISGTRFALGIFNSGQIGYTNNGASFTPVNKTGLTTGVSLLSGYREGANVSAGIDNVYTTAANGDNLGTLTDSQLGHVGNVLYLDGSIAEMLFWIFPSGFDQDIHDRAVAYLSSKYALGI